MRQGIADCAGRREMAAPLATRVWTRLGKLVLRFVALAALAAARGAAAAPAPAPAASAGR